MRIEKIYFNNYRQFRDVTVNFDKSNSHDLTIFIGQNTTGKTNFLNGLNWCLYGQEPHLSKESNQLPRLNLNVIENESEDKEHHVSVKIVVSADNGDHISFERSELYKFRKGEPISQLNEFEVSFTDKFGNWKTATDEEAENKVKRFVPEGLREFFFFDGERLDTYFKNAKKENIREATLKMSRIDVLNTIERNLTTIEKKLIKKAGEFNPQIEKIEKEIEGLRKDKNNLITNIGKCDLEIETAKRNLEDISNELDSYPETEVEEKRRKNLIKTRAQKIIFLERLEKQKQFLIIEYGKIMYSWPAIDKTIEIINYGHEKKIVPPQITEEAVEKTLEKCRCEICGRALEPHSAKHVKSLQETVLFSSTIGKRLSKLESGIITFKKDIRKFATEITTKNEEIEAYKTELNDIQFEIENIDKKLANFDLDRIRKLNKRRKEYAKALDNRKEDLWDLKRKNTNLIQKIQEKETERDKHISEEKQLKDLNKKKFFVHKSLETVSKSKTNIIINTIEKIQKETKNLFFDLIWRKKTYSDVKISKDYDISLIHTLGYDCLGTVSSAERELLALSFTLALHRLSGFNSPMLIDSPVGRVSDENRENFATTFSDVSRKKQIILLFTPSDYSDEIISILETKACNKLKFKLSSDERELTMVAF